MNFRAVPRLLIWAEGPARVVVGGGTEGGIQPRCSQN